MRRVRGGSPNGTLIGVATPQETPERMTSGQTSESVVDAPQPGAAEVGGPPPQPDAMLELQAFLMQLLQSQVAMVSAMAGAVFLAGGAARKPGLLVQHQAAGEAAPVLAPGVIARMERLAAELCAPDADAGKAPQGRMDTIALARAAGGLYGDEARHRLIAAPLWADGRVEGACVLALRTRGAADEEALKTLMLTTAAFEAFLWKKQAIAESQRTLMLRETLELLDASQQGRSAGTMGALICNELQRRFGCSRVSVGLVHRESIRLTAVTGADEVDRNAAAVEAIEEAMEECAAQDVEVVFPAPLEHEHDPAQRRVTRAHEEVSRKFGPSAMLSLPLRVEGDLVGVVVLERPATDPFPVAAVPLLRLVAETVGPALWTRRLADRGVLAVTRDRLLDLGEAMVGPRHTGAKLVTALVLLVLVLAAVVPIPARIKSAVEVKALHARTVVPPFTGYLETVLVKPGDRVQTGQVMATMDTSSLALELSENEARLTAYTVQRDDALSKGELSKRMEIESQINEVASHLALLRDHQARSVIRSPIDGLVGRGDLDSFIRARVEPTQPLFEVISQEQQATLYIEEADVQRVREGMTGGMVIRSLPGREVEIRVTRVNPAAEVVRGRNVYQAEAELVGVGPDDAAWLRPGMTGTAKLRDGRTTTLATLLRSVVEEIRMRMWW